MSRWSLPAIVLLAAALHAIGIARTLVPAQDGLKFIRVAKRFQIDNWTDAVKLADQHPLYPAAIAAFQPLVRCFTGSGPESWRISAQGLSAVASILLLIPLYVFSSRLFDSKTAVLSILFYVLLPIPASIGHDTLSDAPALLCFLLSFTLGQRALESGHALEWLLAGLIAGIGYWTRPEVALAAAAIGIATLAIPYSLIPRKRKVVGLLMLTLGLGSFVALYAIVKGDLSEKLAMRTQTHRANSTPLVLRKVPQWLPKGLDDPRWDFSAKEQTTEPTPQKVTTSARMVAVLWIEGMGYVFAPLAFWGFVRARCRGVGACLSIAYALLFACILIRHAASLGYVSHRHVLSLIVLSLPWSAAALRLMAARLAGWLRRFPGVARALNLGVLSILVAVGVWAQVKPSHPTRWGHWAAGRWLREHSGPGEAVLDTRGWASFVSGTPSYDYWHVRQSLSDARLTWIVVGSYELSAKSRRAETLRGVLGRAGDLAISFPEVQGRHGRVVLVYRYRKPDSWEGLR